MFDTSEESNKSKSENILGKFKFRDDTIGTVFEDWSVEFAPNSVPQFFKSEQVNSESFLYFLSDRVVSRHRKDIDKIIARMGEQEYSLTEIIKITHAISNSDDYWVSFNDFEDYRTLKSIVLEQKYLKGVSSPSGCSQKEYFAKSNECGGILKEPIHRYSTDIENEVLIYRLGKLFHIDCCYAEIIDKKVFSKYSFNPQEEYIFHGRYLYINPEDVLNFPEIIDRAPIGVKQFLINMLVFDFITRQEDRHGSNWAVRANYTTREISTYSLYDNGKCLFYEEDPRSCVYLVRSIELNSTTFGEIGDYFEIAEELKDKHTLNLNISVGDLSACFIGLDNYPEFRKEAAIAWMMKCVNFLSN